MGGHGYGANPPVGWDREAASEKKVTAEVKAAAKQKARSKSPRMSFGLGSEWNDSDSDPCFHGDCCVRTPTGEVPLKLVRKGDQVLTASGQRASIVCVIVSPTRSGTTSLVIFPKMGLRTTPHHPVRVDGVWRFPGDLRAPTLERTEFVYNVVLDHEHVMVVDSVECITLGHGIVTSPVTIHPYLGTHRVVNDRKACRGWCSGIVCIESLCRDPDTNLVCGITDKRWTVNKAAYSRKLSGAAIFSQSVRVLFVK